MLTKIRQKLHAWAEPVERWLPPVRLGILLLALITIFLLFVPPVSGPVDDGTYNLILHANGLREFTGDSNYYKYFVPQFPILQYYNPDAHLYLSLQNVLIQAASLVYRIFYGTKIFDDRSLGAIYTVPLVLACRSLFNGLTLRLIGIA